MSEFKYKLEDTLFPEAVRLMRLRHKLDKYFRKKDTSFSFSDGSKEERVFIEELRLIELELYKK